MVSSEMEYKLYISINCFQIYFFSINIRNTAQALRNEVAYSEVYSYYESVHTVPPASHLIPC